MAQPLQYADLLQRRLYAGENVSSWTADTTAILRLSVRATSAAALDALEQDAAERGLPFVIVSVAEPMIERIEAVRPGKFTFSHDNEDGDDYIYLAEKLRTLSGKKLQSKRNLVNRFKAAYEGRWSYEDMTRENIKDAFAFHIHWCNLNGCARERDFEGETCAIVQALHNFDYLNRAADCSAWTARLSRSRSAARLRGYVRGTD